MAAITTTVIAVWQFGPYREPVHAKRPIPTLKLDYKLHSLEAGVKP